MRWFLKWVWLSNSVLSRVPYYYRISFSRLKMVVLAVVWGTGHVSSHPGPVVASTIVRTMALQCPPCGFAGVWCNPSARPPHIFISTTVPYHRGFTHLACRAPINLVDGNSEEASCTLDAEEEYWQDILKRSKQHKRLYWQTYKSQGTSKLKKIGKLASSQHKTFLKALTWPIQLGKF